MVESSVWKCKHSMLSTISYCFQKLVDFFSYRHKFEKFPHWLHSGRNHTDGICSFAEEDLTLEAKMGKRYLKTKVPGSKGHSLSFANSAGVFPVRTQLELRSIIGILQETQKKIWTVKFRMMINMISHIVITPPGYREITCVVYNLGMKFPWK